MPIISGGGGGSLPSQWTVTPSTGRLVIQTTGPTGDSDFANVLEIDNADSRSILTLNSSGELTIGLGDANASGPLIGPRGPAPAGSHMFTVSGGIFDVEKSTRTTVQGLRTTAITSGALPTQAFVSGTAAQVSTDRDVLLVIPFTGDATNNAATLKVELSPDNFTYSTLDTLSIAAALNLTGALNVPVTVVVPAGFYVKLTATHGTIGTATYY